MFFDVTAKSPWVAEAPPAAQIANDVTPGASARDRVSRRHPRRVLDIARRRRRHSSRSGSRKATSPWSHTATPTWCRARRACAPTPNLEAHRRPEDANALPFANPNRRGGPGRYPSDLRLLQLRRAAVQSAARTRCRVSCGSASDAVARVALALLDQFIRFATAESGNKRAGSQSVLNRLSELMFVEVVRLHMDQLANNNTGWLAGLRDPLVGRALTLLHGRPSHAWTLEELASEAAASRSALADRFTQIVGCPPIQYLTQWRMQLAAKRLADPSVKSRRRRA